MTLDLYTRLRDADPAPYPEDYDQARTAMILARIHERAPSAGGDRHPVEPGRPPRDRAKELAALVVLVLVIGGAVLWLSRLSPQTVTAAAPDATSPATTKSAASGPPRTGLLAYRGVTVPVPQSMLDPHNAICAKAVADAAYIVQPADPDTYSLCALAFGPDRAPTPNPPVTEVVLMASEAAKRIGPFTDGESVLPDGRTMIVTTFEDQQVVLLVVSPDADVARSYTTLARVPSTSVPPLPRSVETTVAAAGDTMRIMATPVGPKLAATLLDATRVQFSSFARSSPVLGVSYARVTLPNYGHIGPDGTVTPIVSDRAVLVVGLRDVLVPALGPGPVPGSSPTPDADSAKGTLLAFYDARTHEFISASTY